MLTDNQYIQFQMLVKRKTNLWILCILVLRNLSHLQSYLEVNLKIKKWNTEALRKSSKTEIKMKIKYYIKTAY